MRVRAWHKVSNEHAHLYLYLPAVFPRLCHYCFCLSQAKSSTRENNLAFNARKRLPSRVDCPHDSLRFHVKRWARQPHQPTVLQTRFVRRNGLSPRLAINPGVLGQADWCSYRHILVPNKSFSFTASSRLHELHFRKDLECRPEVLVGQSYHTGYLRPC